MRQPVEAAEPTGPRRASRPDATHHVLDGAALYAAASTRCCLPRAGPRPRAGRRRAFHVDRHGRPAYSHGSRAPSASTTSLAAVDAAGGRHHILPDGDSRGPERSRGAATSRTGAARTRPDGGTSTSTGRPPVSRPLALRRGLPRRHRRRPGRRRPPHRTSTRRRPLHGRLVLGPRRVPQGLRPRPRRTTAGCT